jgi:hypothetical protein
MYRDASIGCSGGEGSTLALMERHYRRDLPGHSVLTIRLVMSGCCFALLIVLLVGS